MNDKSQIPIVTQLGNFSSGVTDGLTISLALAAGLSFAGFENKLVAIACATVSFAVAVVMGAGSFLSRRDQINQTPANSLKEWQRTKHLLEGLGLTAEQVALAEEDWLKEQQEENEAVQHVAPFSKIFVTSLAFLCGGLVPAMSFYLSGQEPEAFRVSVVVSTMVFVTFGYIGDKANGINPWWGALRALLIGAAAILLSIAIANVLIKFSPFQ